MTTMNRLLFDLWLKLSVTFAWNISVAKVSNNISSRQTKVLAISLGSNSSPSCPNKTTVMLFLRPSWWSRTLPDRGLTRAQCQDRLQGGQSIFRAEARERESPDVDLVAPAVYDTSEFKKQNKDFLEKNKISSILLWY